jgi:hypothetical protein
MLTAGCARPPAAVRVGAPARVVGQPFTEASAFARNVWDMQRFAGRIFIGHGDLADNWGPVALWALDPGRRPLRSAYLTDLEQIGRLRGLDDGALYLPAVDPRGRGSGGGFDRLAGSRWVRRRTIAGALHTFDVVRHGGALFAALGGDGSTPTLVRSADGGQSWTPVSDETGRIFSLLQLAGELYAAPRFRGGAATPLLRWDGARFTPTALGTGELLPGLPDTSGSIPRAEAFHDELVYVGAAGAVDWRPYALLRVHPPAPAARITLPAAEAVPWDLLTRGDTLLVLASVPAGDGGTLVLVYASQDLARWREVVRFTAPTFARSFEDAGGDLYFGLGCGYRRPSAACGTIVMVGRADLH